MRPNLISLLFALAIINVAPSAAEAQTCDPNSISVSEYGRMTDPIETIVLIVPTKLSRECLLALGKSLHEQKSIGRYEFFDSRDVNLGLYIRCNSKEIDSKLACDRYSLKWIEKHTVGFLNVDTDVPGDRCPHWALFDKEHHSISEYERVSWCPYKIDLLCATPHNKSLDRSGGSAFLNLLGAAQVGWIRAARSTQTFDGYD